MQSMVRSIPSKIQNANDIDTSTTQLRHEISSDFELHIFVGLAEAVLLNLPQIVSCLHVHADSNK